MIFEAGNSVKRDSKALGRLIAKACAGWKARALAAEARAEAAESQISALQDSVRLKDEALRPFALAFEMNSLDGPCLTIADVRAMHEAVAINDFRRASQALGGGDG